jgi:hypothetical protein
VIKTHKDDREHVLRLVQDLRVKLRDEENMNERIKLQNVIRKFEEGMKEEFKTY